MANTFERPFSDVRLKPGEKPSPERLMQIFEAIQGNFDGLFGKFPVRTEDIANRSIAKPVIAGIVGAAGEIKAGSGFTIEKGAAGVYTINLSKELATVGAVNITPEAPLRTGACSTLNGKKTFAISIFNTSSTAAENIAFHFMIKAT